MEMTSLLDNNALSFYRKKGGRNRRNFTQAFKDQKTSSTSGYDPRKDISKIQCFRYDKYGHYARNFPTKREEDNMLPLLTLIQTHLRRMNT